jgi:hypothetical protein
MPPSWPRDGQADASRYFEIQALSNSTVDFIVGVMPCTFGDQLVCSSTFACA